MNPERKQKFAQLGDKLKGIAPFVASLLGGPAVGAGVKVLTDFLGSDNDDPEVLEGLVGALPVDKILELKKVDVELRRSEADIEMNLQDNLTRRLESDNATNSKFVQFLRPSLAIYWSLITSGAIGVVLWGDPTKEAIYSIALFASGAVMAAIIGFCFGGRSVEKIAAIRRP